MWVHCNSVLENAQLKELTNAVEIIVVPFSFDLTEISAFRVCTSESGEIEPYTLLIFHNGHVECIDMEHHELKEIFRRYELQGTANTSH